MSLFSGLNDVKLKGSGEDFKYLTSALPVGDYTVQLVDIVHTVGKGPKNKGIDMVILVFEHEGERYSHILYGAGSQADSSQKRVKELVVALDIPGDDCEEAAEMLFGPQKGAVGERFTARRWDKDKEGKTYQNVSFGPPPQE